MIIIIIIAHTTQLTPTNTMRKVEKSVENGPSRKDKYRTRRPPKRETNNNNLSPRASRRTTSTKPNPDDGKGEANKIQSGNSQIEKRM